MVYLLACFIFISVPISGQTQELKPQSPSRFQAPKWASYDAMHEFYVGQFVKSEGFGLIRRMRMDDPIFRQVSIAGNSYAITGLDLVSLLKHKIPVVYLSRLGGLTRKNYKNAKTRTLTEFEQEGLAKLLKGQTYVGNSKAEQLELVGAIRAGKSCLSCHHVSEGELLGAFTYHLRPTGN